MVSYWLCLEKIASILIGRISSEDKHRKSSSLGQDWLLTDSINPEHKKVCIPRKQGRGYNMGRNHSPAERAEISLAHLAAAA